MSKEQQQDKSFELTYLVMHFRKELQEPGAQELDAGDLQTELDAINQVNSKYRPIKDRKIYEWYSASDLGDEYRAKHCLLQPIGEKWDEDYKKRRINKLEAYYQWVVSIFPKAKQLIDLTNDCETSLGSWLKIVSDLYEKPEKRAYTSDRPKRIAENGEPYYTVIPSVDSISYQTQLKVLKMPSGK